MKKIIGQLMALTILAFASANATAQKIVFAANPYPKVELKYDQNLCKVQIMNEEGESVDFDPTTKYIAGSKIEFSTSKTSTSDAVKFIGWYVNGKLVETETRYTHTVLSDATIIPYYVEYVDLSMDSGTFWAKTNDLALDETENGGTFMKLSGDNPTKEQWEELLTYTWTAGENGYTITDNPFYPSKSLFLPYGEYWTNSHPQNDNNNAYYLEATKDTANVDKTQYIENKLSVRRAIQGVPHVETYDATDVDYTSATLNFKFTEGEIIKTEEMYINIYKKDTPGTNISGSPIKIGTTASENTTITGLEPNTTYKYQAVTKDSDGIYSRGSEIIFTTKAESVAFTLTTTAVYPTQINFDLTMNPAFAEGNEIKSIIAERSANGDFSDVTDWSEEFSYEEKDGSYACRLCSLYCYNAKAIRIVATDKNNKTYTSEPLQFVLPTTQFSNDYHTYVDLGLPSGNLWAAYNVGAAIPEGKGTAYTHQTSVNTAEDTWSEKWNIPLNDDWEELMNEEYCTATQTTINGISGYLITSKKTEYTNNQLFLPLTNENNAQYWSETEVDGTYYIYDSSKESKIQSIESSSTDQYHIRPILHGKPQVELITNPSDLKYVEGKGYEIQFKLVATSSFSEEWSNSQGIKYWKTNETLNEATAISVSNKNSGEVYTAYIKDIEAGTYYVCAYANDTKAEGYSEILTLTVPED